MSTTGYINIPVYAVLSWRPPVATVSDLPNSGNNDGDAIVAKDTGIIYVWTGAAWENSADTAFWVVNTTFYVDNSRMDSYVPDGSVYRPFTTIGAALTAAASNSIATIIINSDHYSENIVIDNSNLIYLTFYGLGQVFVGNISCTTNNANLTDLLFYNINGLDVTLTGDTNNTNFGYNFVYFFNSQINGTLTLTNVNTVYLDSNSYLTGLAVQNVNLVGLNEGTYGNSGTCSFVTNNSANAPQGFSGTTAQFFGKNVFSSITVDAGSALRLYTGVIGTFGGSFSCSGLLYIYAANVRSNLTMASGSTLENYGGVISGTFTNSGATISNNGSTFLNSIILGSNAVPATNATVVSKDGHFKSTQTTAPTTTLNGNAGSGGTPATSVSHATDNAGSLSLTTGTGSWSSGVQTTVNFNLAYNVAPIAILTPTNANAANEAVSRGVYVSSTVNGFSVNFATADTAQTTYTWNYQVIETQ